MKKFVLYVFLPTLLLSIAGCLSKVTGVGYDYIRSNFYLNAILIGSIVISGGTILVHRIISAVSIFSKSDNEGDDNEGSKNPPDDKNV